MKKLLDGKRIVWYINNIKSRQTKEIPIKAMEFRINRSSQSRSQVVVRIK